MEVASPFWCLFFCNKHHQFSWPLWSASQANIVKTCLEKIWTTTSCPPVLINRVCRQQLIEIRRQPLKLVGRESPQRPEGPSANEGKGFNQQCASQNRGATKACIILLCTALDREIIFFVKYLTKHRRAPPETLGRVHAVTWCGETGAVDEASRDDMGGLLGQRCLTLSSETRTCVRWLPVQISICSLLVAQSLSTFASNSNLQLLPAHPSTPKSPNLQSLFNQPHAPNPNFQSLSAQLQCQPT